MYIMKLYIYTNHIYKMNYIYICHIYNKLWIYIYNELCMYV
jgi:hypothetical protein